MRIVPVSAVVIGERCRKDLGDLKALAASIEAVGLLHPPVVTEDLHLVAGERRLAAVQLLGWQEVPVTVAVNMADVQRALHAERDENTCRKDLSPSEAVSIGARIEEIERPKAEARQAEAGKANLPTVSAGKLPSLTSKARVRDVAGSASCLSGRTYEKAKAVVRAAEQEPETFAPLVAEMDRTGKVDRAFNALKKQRAEESDAAKAQAVADTADKWQVFNVPVNALAEYVDEGTVDAIVTDPPYPEEFLPAYSDLSAFAAHALKPGGVLLAMVGQAHLPEVIERLSERLTYHWCMAYVMPGATAKMWGRKVIVGWKPVLMFVNGGDGWEPENGIMPIDVAKSGERDKQHHHWGQSESGLADLIEKVTSPGAIVVDPFCGGGSAGVAAVGLKRYFIGADIDAAAVNRTKVRLAEVV